MHYFIYTRCWKNDRINDRKESFSLITSSWHGNICLVMYYTYIIMYFKIDWNIYKLTIRKKRKINDSNKSNNFNTL